MVLTVSDSLIKKYPNHAFILVDIDINNTKDVKKYLAHSLLNLGEFIFIVRNKYNIDKNKALFCFINNSIIANHSDNVVDIYNKYKNKETNLLNIKIIEENTFG